MQSRKIVFGGSSTLYWSLGIAIVAACNVYDSSLLTGGSAGQGGTSSAGDGGGGDAGTATGGSSGDSGGNTGGGTSGSSGKGGSAGMATGGSEGGSGGDTGGTGKGGTSAGEGGEDDTGGTAGGGAGSGGKGGMGGMAGDAGTGGSSGGMCGKCGCGNPDTPDTDGDGVLDCVDMCPDLNDADCSVLRSGLVHRYSFNGTGTAVMDSKGTAHGTVMGMNAALSGSGTLVLAGGVSPQSSDPNKQYVDLPDDILTGLTNTTFEAWVTWTTATNWQRIFDFGSAATGTSGAYVFLTPRTTSSGGCRAAISTAGSAAETAAGGAQVNGPVITTAMPHHYVFIIDDTNDTVSLYVDGTLGSTVGFTGTIASIAGTNNWLGRSNYTTAADPYLSGTFDEFRIYNVALTPAQLRTSRTAGPNATVF